MVVVARDELDQLLEERFRLRRADIVAALRTLPAIKGGTAALSQDHASVLDEAGFVEDQEAHAMVAVDIAIHTALLISSAYSASQVASILGVSRSRVRQRRVARTLWAIPHQRTWIFPALQFEPGANTELPVRQVRGLDQVLPALPPDLHPAAVAGFLHTPQIDLQMKSQPQSPLDWLRNGGDVQSVLPIIEAANWAAR